MSTPTNQPRGRDALLGTLVSLAITLGLLAAIIVWKKITLEELAANLQGADKGI